jgi:hypothetical protein
MAKFLFTLHQVIDEIYSDHGQILIFLDIENFMLRKFVYVQTYLYFKQNFY